MFLFIFGYVQSNRKRRWLSMFNWKGLGICDDPLEHAIPAFASKEYQPQKPLRLGTVPHKIQNT